MSRGRAREMDILIVNLPRYRGIPVFREGRCEQVDRNQIATPASLLIAASILRKQGHKINFVDANAFDLSFRDISKLIQEEKVDCVLFSFNSFVLNHDLSVCKLTKKIDKNCITIGYSWYSRFYAEEILKEYPDLDVLIVGRPLPVIGDIVKCLYKNRDLEKIGGIAYRAGNGQIEVNTKITTKKAFADLPLPAYDLLPSFKPYRLLGSFSPFALVISGEGCPYGCKFCNVAKSRYDCRSPSGVTEELLILERFARIKYVWFFEEVFTIDRERTVEICERIAQKNIGIKWFCSTRVDLVDESLLRLMHRCGCIGISYGVESGNQSILNSMYKWFSIEQAKTALCWTRKAHIPIQMNLVLGYRGETAETLKETETLVRTILPERLQAGIARLSPGSEFAEEEFENHYNNKKISWKNRIAGKIDSTHHNLNSRLRHEIKRINRILFTHPKWWISSASSLMWNRDLILPLIRKYMSQASNMLN
jgi:anaerobic magnesium-protoporphyrin IX monomethyl ester cyclase